MRTTIVLLGWFLPFAAAAGPLPDDPHVYVEGQHTVTVEPDRFSVRVSISEVAPTSSAAATAVSKRLTSLLKQAQSIGVPESHIRAFQIEVAPEHERIDGKERLVGTRVTREVEFSLDEIASTQQLLDALVGSDIAEIQHARASSTQEAALREAAVERAISHARTRAERIANSVGAKLGRVHSVSEFEEHYRPVQMSDFAGYAGLASGAGPFKPGPIEVSGRVYVVFLLEY